MSKPRAERIYLGDCPECDDGLALFFAQWEQGKPYMKTALRCTDCEHMDTVKIAAEENSGQPQYLAGMYLLADLDPVIGPVYSVSLNCTLELPE